jgi:hypothetical protein
LRTFPSVFIVFDVPVNLHVLPCVQRSVRSIQQPSLPPSEEKTPHFSFVFSSGYCRCISFHFGCPSMSAQSRRMATPPTLGPVSPVTVQEALKAFSEIQRLAVQDNRDPERFLASRDGTAAAAATGTGGAAPATRSGSLANGRSTRSASSATPGQHGAPPAAGKSSGGGATTDADTSQLKKRLELAETVIKKLHDKNRALQAEVNSLKTTQMPNAGAGPAASRPPTGAAAEAPRPTTADQASLQLRVREQEATIAALRAQLQQVQATAAAAAAVGAAPTSSPAGGAATSVSDATAAAELRLVREQLVQSRKQYDALATVNLDCVREGEATGKVNKEVKAFFVTTRQKMLEDSAAQEAERALLHGRIAELEVQLAHARNQQGGTS